MTMEPMTTRIANSVEKLEKIDMNNIDAPLRILRAIDDFIPTTVSNVYKEVY